MNHQVGGVVLILAVFVALLPLVSAEDISASAAAAVNARVDESNRFLAAETSRQIKGSQDQLLVAINANNDDNFRIFDVRMTSFMDDLKKKVIIGGIGAILVANAIVALMMMRTWKRYSYETYLQTIIGKQAELLEGKDKQVEELKVLQQPQWSPQVPQQTIGMQIGPTAAAEISRMNEWQTQPTYQGAWVSPQQTQQEWQQPSQMGVQQPSQMGVQQSVQQQVWPQPEQQQQPSQMGVQWPGQTFGGQQ